jgi:hypothetical protein
MKKLCIGYCCLHLVYNTYTTDGNLAPGFNPLSLALFYKEKITSSEYQSPEDKIKDIGMWTSRNINLSCLQIYSLYLEEIF